MPTIRELAGIVNEDPKQVSDDLAAYKRVREAALRDGMDGIPSLPDGMLEAASRPDGADEGRLDAKAGMVNVMSSLGAGERR